MRNIYLILFLSVFLSKSSPVNAAGPFGGSVTDIVLAPDGKTPEVVSTTRGLFSFENGLWRRTESLVQRDIRNILPAGNRVLAVEEHRGLLAASTWTADKWSPVLEGLKGRYGTRADDINRLTATGDLNTIYAASAGQGAFASSDGGLEWRQLLAGIEDEPPPAYYVLDILPPQGSRPLLMATDGRGIYALSSGEWEKFGAGLPDKLRAWALSAHKTDPLRLAVATRANGLWGSEDGGKTWNLMRKGLYGVVEVVSFGEDGALLAHFPEEGLYIFHDGKAQGSLGLKTSKVNALVARKGGGWWAALDHDGVVEISPDGKPGAFFNKGLNATRIKSIIKGKDGALWTGDSNGVFNSTDGGNSWESRDQGLYGAAVNNFLWHNGELYLGSAGQGVYQWMKDKSEWEPRIKGMGTANTIFSFVEDADGKKLYVGTEGGILRLDDGNDKWVRKNGDMPIYSVWLVAASKTTPGRLWAAGGKSLFRTEDGGESWKEIEKIQVAALAADVDSGSDRLWAAENNGMSVLTSEASEKAEVRMKLARGERIQCISPADEFVWVGTSQGIWRVDDGLKAEQVWKGASVHAFLLDNEKLFAGTDGEGVIQIEM